MFANVTDRTVAAGLSLLLHVLIILVSMMPPGNYFFPFIGGYAALRQGGVATPAHGGDSGDIRDKVAEASADQPGHGGEVADGSAASVAAVPYVWQDVEAVAPTVMSTAVRGSSWQRIAQKPVVRSLFRQTRPVELTTPGFPVSTMMPQPENSILAKMAAVDDSYLLTDVYQEAIPAGLGWDVWLARAEADFTDELHRDILDGRLDMAFSRFLIHAEYFQLSKTLLGSGQKPAFDLDEALAVYDQRLQRVAQDLPETLTGYGLIMLLQRYAENKYYPENGSGMLLDALFHNLNDCEGGTKEILAYLAQLYPGLRLGSNRGMVQTTSGEFIGHMQVYIGADPVTRKILDNRDGIVVETTRVGLDSILPWQSGEVYPLEDFVIYYYPEVVAGTPVAALYGGGDGPGGAMDIVGTSNNPLKKSYSGTSTLLSSHSYDLSNIRSRRIENEFLRSEIETCDPRIDPLAVDNTNLFANFVAADGKLRRDLVRHYLADMPYWDNQVMPQWKKIDYIAGYDDLVRTLAEAGDQPGYISPDPLQAVDIKRFTTHSRFLAYVREMSRRKNPGPVAGGQACAQRTVLHRELLEYLFLSPAAPGVFFLPSPEHTNWAQLMTALQDDCLAVEDSPAVLQLFGDIKRAAENESGSLRGVLLARAQSRGKLPDVSREQLAQRLVALKRLFRGAEEDNGRFSGRYSGPSTATAPSVAETVATRGRTGINPGLVRDVYDLGGAGLLRELVADYGGRGDLQLTVPRAVQFLRLVASFTDHANGRPERLVRPERLGWLGGMQLDETLQLALLIDRQQGAYGNAAVSPELAAFLKNMTNFKGETLHELLPYGLTRADAAAVIRDRLSGALITLAEEGTDMFSVVRELAELREAVELLDDAGLARFFGRSLLQETILIVGKITATGNDAGVDLGGVLSLLYLVGSGFSVDDSVKAADFLEGVTALGAKSSLAKFAVGLVDDAFSEWAYRQSLVLLVARQDARLARLSAAGGEARLPALVDELARANIIVRLLLDLPAGAGADLAGAPPEGFQPSALWPGRWYLERLHRQLAGIMARQGSQLSASTGVFQADKGASAAWRARLEKFYALASVRESFSLLSYTQQAERGDVVKFRKMRDLRTIKDPSAVKVVNADRRVTLQDMSLLTLALAPENEPKEIRKSWEQTLGVITSHLDYVPFSTEFRSYLFAPNWPYLAENDDGFFYSPEAVADLHNADSWGGRNDILLSSYLHFQNLPADLPEWLLRTAVSRSEFEREVLDKFSRLSFLPMILECTDDHRMLPAPLFQAKWVTRKPFGEDIFPATLLLLRLGYLDINEAGALITTEKIGGGA